MLVAGKLFVVATPIGNGGDITDRARRVLAEADIVAAEDTRTTKKLFAMLGIRNKMVSNHKFNESRQSDYLVSEMLGGRNVAIVSDAGTPCISDPGHAAVAAAVAAGIDAVCVCGASSVAAALSVSGFFFTSYAFYGFFPRDGKGAGEALRRAAGGDVPVSVFFESPKRIQKTLCAMAGAEELAGAEICLCNDLTKLHERIYRGAPQAVLDEVAGNPSSGKGEYTLVLRAPAKQKPQAALWGGPAAGGFRGAAPPVGPGGAIGATAGSAAAMGATGFAADSAAVGAAGRQAAAGSAAGTAAAGSAAGAAAAYPAGPDSASAATSAAGPAATSAASPAASRAAGPPASFAAARACAAACESLEAMLVDCALKNGYSMKAAIQALQQKYRGKAPKRELYAAALNLRALLPGLFPSDDSAPPEG
jgi:16S rRNA (cytidine1402-2'-O)-methyltransferase